MKETKTLLTKEETKRLIHTRLKPILVKSKGITINDLFRRVNIDSSNFICWAFLSFVGMIMCAQLIAEVHGNPMILPFSAAIPHGELNIPSTSNSIINMPVVRHYDPIEKDIINSLGDKNIRLNNKSIVRYDIPAKYYDDINFSLFKMLSYYNLPSAGKGDIGLNVIRGEKLYTDDYGFIRYIPGNGQFAINNQPDYVISNDIFSQKEINGNRYLIVTNSGMYTIITDDERDEVYSDQRGSYTPRFSGLTGNDTIEKVYNFFRQRGCSHESAIGILANMKQESGINPNSCRSDETAKGIVQWRGGRFNSLVEFAGQRGRDWTDLESQLEFLWVELNSSDMNDRMRGSVASQNLSALGISGHPEGFEGFKNTDDARYATALFEGSFERSGGSAMQNRYGAIYALDKKLKNNVDNKSGLLKWIANQESGNVPLLHKGEDLSPSVKVLQSRILCIYRID